jgi:hypothetical protein
VQLSPTSVRVQPATSSDSKGRPINSSLSPLIFISRTHYSTAADRAQSLISGNELAPLLFNIELASAKKFNWMRSSTGIVAPGGDPMNNASRISEQAAACRALAERARRLAGTFVDGPDRNDFLDYAKELEAQASSLEKQGPDAQ